MSTLLDQVTIASPCPARWDEMTGNEKSRFCSQCQKNVYNFSAMTSNEAETLIKEKEGNLCGRFFRRADGMTLTQDCPVGMEKIRARAQVIKQTMATFLVGIMGFVLGLALPQKWKQPIEDALVKKMTPPPEITMVDGPVTMGVVCVTPTNPPQLPSLVNTNISLPSEEKKPPEPFSQQP
jgi:hypothetical protein